MFSSFFERRRKRKELEAGLLERMKGVKDEDWEGTHRFSIYLENFRLDVCKGPQGCFRIYGLEVYLLSQKEMRGVEPSRDGPKTSLTATYLTSFSGFVYEDIYKRLRKGVKTREKQARQKVREEREKERMLGLKDLEWTLQDRPSKEETP